MGVRDNEPLVGCPNKGTTVGDIDFLPVDLAGDRGPGVDCGGLGITHSSNGKALSLLKSHRVNKGDSGIAVNEEQHVRLSQE